MPPVDAQEAIADDDIRALWRSKGGDFHGPHIETGTMAEAKLLPFLRELITAPKQAATMDAFVYVIVQEGGATGELYVHSFDSEADANDGRVECARNGSYSTSPVVKVPASLAEQPGFFDAVAEILRASNQFECVDVPDDVTPPHAGPRR